MVWLRVVVIGVFAFIIFPLSFNCSNYYPGFDRSLFFNFLDLLCIATIPGAFWCNASYWKCELSCLIHSTCLTCMLILIGHAVQFLIYEQCLSLCSARITPPRFRPGGGCKCLLYSLFVISTRTLAIWSSHARLSNWPICGDKLIDFFPTLSTRSCAIGHAI